MKKNSKSKFAVLGLLAVAILWGFGFVAVDMAMAANMPPLLIMLLRFIIATLFLLIIFFEKLKGITKDELKLGILGGIFLFIAFYLQTVGQKLSTASKSAFLSSLNVVMVPFLVWILQKKRPKIKSFVISIVSLIGAAVMSLMGSDGFSFQMGDVLLIVCAFFFACHVTFLGVYGGTHLNTIRVTFLQMATASVVSILFFLIFQLNTLQVIDFKAGIPPMLYVGLISTCVCYLLQFECQKYIPPIEASLILSTESIFGAIFSVALGFENITLALILGGIIIFGSVISSGIGLKEIKRILKLDNK